MLTKSFMTLVPGRTTLGPSSSKTGWWRHQSLRPSCYETLGRFCKTFSL